MTEQLHNQLPLERVITSLVRVETGNIGLEKALREIGFDISSSLLYDEKDIVISVWPTLKPNSHAAINLVLSNGGIFHIPQKDGCYEDKEAPPARLNMVSVDVLEKSVTFSFQGVNDPIERRFIKLQTGYSRDDWGSI